jgi:hypothetical protein
MSGEETVHVEVLDPVDAVDYMKRSALREADAQESVRVETPMRSPRLEAPPPIALELHEAIEIFGSQLPVVPVWRTLKTRRWAVNR